MVETPRLQAKRRFIEVPEGDEIPPAEAGGLRGKARA
jgi:hypothetical protein